MRTAERLARGAAAITASLLASACGEIAPVVALPDARVASPPPPAEARAEAGGQLGGRWDRSLAGLRQEDQRVANVAFRIAAANADLCPDKAPVTGLVLQTALQYSPRVRGAAEAYFRLGDRPAIEAVAVGSPAAEAGLEDDDVILAIDGRPLSPTPAAPTGPDTRPPTYAPVERALAALQAALESGPARLTVQRGSARLELTLQSRIGCAYDAQVTPGPDLNATADGRHVFITSALVSYARSDDMLALMMGHEFAHDVLHHRERLDRVGVARKALGDFGSTPASLILAEKEADYVGLYLTARAGYDISDAAAFWSLFPDQAPFSWSHPGAAERAASLAATTAEIEAKRARGEPLTPNPASTRQ